jgi:hypothetical protein
MSTPSILTWPLTATSSRWRSQAWVRLRRRALGGTITITRNPSLLGRMPIRLNRHSSGMLGGFRAFPGLLTGPRINRACLGSSDRTGGGPVDFSTKIGTTSMRLLDQRPRYQEGSPRGPVTWGSPVEGRGCGPDKGFSRFGRRRPLRTQSPKAVAKGNTRRRNARSVEAPSVTRPEAVDLGSIKSY